MPRNVMMIVPALALVAVAALVGQANGQTPVPDAVAAKGEVAVLRVQAQGAQIYECKAGGAGGGLNWQFREPIAALFVDGKTIGRHYAGPTWEHADGSIVVGKVAGRAPGASANDIPLLKLDVSEHRGSGILKDVTAIQRLATKGGVLEGRCPKTGEMESVAYGADYVFLRKGQ